MPILTTCVLSASLALATGFLLTAKAIRGWWLRTIVAVFGLTPFQLLYPLEQPLDQFISLRQLFSQRLVFGSQTDQFFFWLHALEFTPSLALLQVCRRTT
jgi:hypothetical protein